MAHRSPFLWKGHRRAPSDCLLIMQRFYPPPDWVIDQLFLMRLFEKSSVDCIGGSRHGSENIMIAK